MKILTVAILLFWLIGCSLPTTTVNSVDSRPSLAVKGASPRAELIVDGLNMGLANSYNGSPQTLTIEPGTHRVVIMDNGMIVFEQAIFVESEIKTIFVH